MRNPAEILQATPNPKYRLARDCGQRIPRFSVVGQFPVSMLLRHVDYFRVARHPGAYPLLIASSPCVPRAKHLELRHA